MHISKVNHFCRHASLDQLGDSRQQLIEGLMTGALAGTNALACLQIVEREIAQRELSALFQVDRTTAPE